MKPSTPRARGNWENKTEFFLSCMGYAIGIGNVWRFPYLCYRNGGGAFLVPYLLMLFFCGIPLFFLETSLGQFAGTGCITIFKICPLLKALLGLIRHIYSLDSPFFLSGTGYAILVVNFICTTYYNTIIAYPLLFLFNCFRVKLPWIDCDNPWNTERCAELQIRGRINESSSTSKTPADEFFHKKILQISDDVEDIGAVVWPLFICNIIAWAVVYLCIMKGVKSVGKVVYFTATFPFVILIVLFVRGVTLPGAWSGIFFYVYPQWHQLLNLKVWADASIQIFFSLGPGWGSLINMASYNKFRNDNKRDSILVPILNSGTSIFAGFVVFSVLGFMSHQTGLPVSSAATGGPGLAFVTYPEAITMLPWSHLWAVLFFIMLFLLGLDSCFVQIEAIISSIIDEYPTLKNHKALVTLFACLLMMIFSTVFVTNGGMYYLQLFDWYAASISVILICLVEVITVGWIYGVGRFVKDIEFMTQNKLDWWWPFCWKYMNPVILAFIFATAIIYNTRISYNGVIYPEWSVKLGWFSCFCSMICIPVYVVYKLTKSWQKNMFQIIKFHLAPAEDWGPDSKEDRKQWLKAMQSKKCLRQ